MDRTKISRSNEEEEEEDMGEDIPVIDFGAFLNGNSDDRRRISVAIGNACRDVGFFYLANHGVPSRVIAAVYDQAKRFFNQSVDEKMKIYIGSCPCANNRGYTPMFEEKLSVKGDLKEGFDLALELPADDRDRLERGASLYGPNVWPENLPGHSSSIRCSAHLLLLLLLLLLQDFVNVSMITITCRCLRCLTVSWKPLLWLCHFPRLISVRCLTSPW